MKSSSDYNLDCKWGHSVDKVVEIFQVSKLVFTICSKNIMKLVKYQLSKNVAISIVRLVGKFAEKIIDLKIKLISSNFLNVLLYNLKHSHLIHNT